MSHCPEIQEKIKQTNIKKYGVTHLMKKPEHLEQQLKNSFKFKNYILPSGKIIQIQGYEYIALNELIINEKINESDIITGITNVPEILFFDKYNTERSHHPDIFIPKQNRIIEVKSTWTFQKENVLMRQSFGKHLGYKYEIWVYDKKGNKTCYD
jgi:DNA repair protein RadC